MYRVVGGLDVLNDMERVPTDTNDKPTVKNNNKLLQPTHLFHV